LAHTLHKITQGVHIRVLFLTSFHTTMSASNDSEDAWISWLAHMLTRVKLNGSQQRTEKLHGLHSGTPASPKQWRCDGQSIRLAMQQQEQQQQRGPEEESKRLVDEVD
jgi:hypothetical protein